jgi:hypothetical protein
MAAEISEITESNQPCIVCGVRPGTYANYLDQLFCEPCANGEIPEDARAMLAHILTDLHEALRLLTAQGKLQAEHDKLLQEYRPLLDRFAHPLASKIGGRRARN